MQTVDCIDLKVQLGAINEPASIALSDLPVCRAELQALLVSSLRESAGTAQPADLRMHRSRRYEEYLRCRISV